MVLFWPELGLPEAYIFPLDQRGFGILYNIPRPSPHSSHPCKVFGTQKNILSPTIIAALILTAKLMICKENPAKYPNFAKNPPK
jgi:hypothetical protein